MESRITPHVAPYLRRARMRARCRGAVNGAAVGSLALAAMLGLGRVWSFPAVWVGLAVWGGATVGGAFVGVRRLPDVGSLLSHLDAAFGLKDRVRTAWELERTGRTDLFAQAQIEDAIAHLAAHRPETWLPRLVPRTAWLLPVLFALAWTPLLIPSNAVPVPSLTDAERDAIRTAAVALAKIEPKGDLSRASERLRDARSIDEAMRALADAERSARLRAEAAQAMRAARETIRAGIPPDSTSLAAALDASEEGLSEELRAQLAALRKRLAGNAAAADLNAALEGIETRAVSPETLARIVDAMRRLEAQSSEDALAALEQIRAQKKAIAAATLESNRQSRLARLDQLPGRESNDTVAEGARLTQSRSASEGPTTMYLESLKSASGRDVRVYSRDPSRVAGAASTLQPFEAVALSGQREADAISAGESLPIAYRERIRAYFDALAAVGRADR